MNSLLRSVIGILIRQRTPVIPPFMEGQRTVRDEFVKLWEGRRWAFRLRMKKMTITTDGELLNPAGDTDKFDGLASKNIVLLTSNNQRYRLDWVDATRAASISAFYDGKTGRPRFFFDEDRGTIQGIHFWPKPDKTYDAFAGIIIGPPPFLTSANVKDAFAQLPVPFRAHLRDKIIARLLSDFGREDVDAARALRNVEREERALARAWDYKGSSRYNARGHHHLAYLNDTMSYRGNFIFGQYE